MKLADQRAPTEPAANSTSLDDTTPFDRNRPYLSRVLRNERLTPSDWMQDVRHIELDLSEPHQSLAYTPGAVACIVPRNPASEVELFAQRLELSLDSTITEIALVDHADAERSSRTQCPCNTACHRGAS